MNKFISYSHIKRNKGESEFQRILSFSSDSSFYRILRTSSIASYHRTTPHTRLNNPVLWQDYACDEASAL